MKFNPTFTSILKRCIRTGGIPMLLGEPGIGKSSFLEAIATELHTKCFTLACNQLADKADLTGARLVPEKVQVKQPDGTFVEKTEYSQVFYPHKTIMDAVRYAQENPTETPILFLDELNRTTPDITSALLSIPTARTIGNTKLPKNLRVVTAGNDKGNVTALDTASLTRFALFHVTPDAQKFLGLHGNLNQYVRNVISKNPATIFCTATAIPTVDPNNGQNNQGQAQQNANAGTDEIITDEETMSQLTTPRTIAKLSDFLNTLDQKDYLAMIQETYRNAEGLDVSVLQETIEGYTGPTLFSALLLAEISGSVMSIQPTVQQNAVAKPQVYDELKSCTDMMALTQKITALSESDASGCLAYAIYERADNSTIIPLLAGKCPDMPNPDFMNLCRAIVQNDYDTENLQTFMTTNCATSQKISMIAGV